MKQGFLSTILRATALATCTAGLLGGCSSGEEEVPAPATIEIMASLERNVGAADATAFAVAADRLPLFRLQPDRSASASGLPLAMCPATEMHTTPTAPTWARQAPSWS